MRLQVAVEIVMDICHRRRYRQSAKRNNGRNCPDRVRAGSYIGGQLFLALFQLAIESNAVVSLRTIKFMLGGPDAMLESHLMVNEKVEAAIEAASSLYAGATAGMVIERYRQHVAANAERLTHG